MDAPTPQHGLNVSPSRRVIFSSPLATRQAVPREAIVSFPSPDRPSPRRASGAAFSGRAQVIVVTGIDASVAVPVGTALYSVLYL